MADVPLAADFLKLDQSADTSLKPKHVSLRGTYRNCLYQQTQCGGDMTRQNTVFILAELGHHYRYQQNKQLKECSDAVGCINL